MTASRVGICRCASIVVALGLALPLLVPVSGYAESTDPAASRINSFYYTLLEMMKQAKQLGVKGRYDKLAPVLTKTYDLASMSRIAVGQSWSTLSAPQQLSIVNAFTRMTTATYASRFDDFSGEQFEILQTVEQPSGDKIVKTSHHSVQWEAGGAQLSDAQKWQRLEGHRRVSRRHDQRTCEPTGGIRSDPQVRRPRCPGQFACETGRQAACWKLITSRHQPIRFANVAGPPKVAGPQDPAR